MRKLFPGETLFNLKATHGLPLDIALGRILITERIMISWDGYINEARRNNRWDFQIYEEIATALQDAVIPKGTARAILRRVRTYMMRHPLIKDKQ